MKGRRASGLTLEDFLYRPELLMAVAGILAILGALGSWGSYGYYSGGGNATFFMGLIMLYSAAVNLGYVNILEELVPVLNTSAICGSVTFIIAIGGLNATYVNRSVLGLYLTLFAGLIAMFAAFRAYTGGRKIVSSGGAGL